jgi:O-antigen/teichoic acid export membrane protein
MHEYELFAKRIGLVGLANLLAYFSGILLLPVLTKTLSIEEYGIWAQIMVTIGLIPSIVMLGLPYTMVRFLAGSRERNDIQEGFYSIFFIILIIGIVSSFLLFFSSELTATLLFNNNVLIAKILSLIILVECLNSICLNFFRTFQQIRKYSLIMCIQTLLNMLLVSYFVLSGYGITGAAIGVLIAKGLIFITMGLIIISAIGFRIPEFRNIKDYLEFGLPTVPGNLSSWVVTSSDRYIIGIFLGTAYVGLYAPGYALGSTIQMFMGPLGLLLPAVLSKYYDENNINSVKMVLKYSLKYFLLIAIPSAFGLSMLSKPLLVILSTPEISLQGYLVTPFLAISSVFFGAFVITSHIIILEKRTAITGSIYVLSAILNFLLNLVMVPRMGIVGAAFTTMIAYLLLLIVGIHYSFRYIKFDIGLRFIAKSISASIVMCPVIFAWGPNRLSSVIAVVCVCAILYAVVIFLLKGISREEAGFFRELFHI